MKIKPWLIVAIFLSLLSTNGYAQVTGGVLCTDDDPDFDAYYFREHIPRCKRNVTDATKRKVATKYGIDESDWKHYQYDHVISLCAGGSNSMDNLQPRLPKKKLEKDKIEWATCRALDRGNITQREAIETLQALAITDPNE